MAVLRQQITFVHELYETGEAGPCLMSPHRLARACIQPPALPTTLLRAPLHSTSLAPQICMAAKRKRSLSPAAQAWWTRARRMTCWRRWTSACDTWRSPVGGGARTACPGAESLLGSLHAHSPPQPPCVLACPIIQ